MPFTPFHFGPGAALHAISPKRISFIAFCAANVLIDLEPGYYLFTRQFPLHRFFHTYVGATIVSAATIGLSPCRRERFGAWRESIKGVPFAQISGLPHQEGTNEKEHAV